MIQQMYFEPVKTKMGQVVKQQVKQIFKDVQVNLHDDVSVRRLREKLSKESQMKAFRNAQM